MKHMLIKIFHLNLSICNNEIQINYEIKESLSKQIDLIKTFKGQDNINYENMFVTCNCAIKYNFNVKDLNFDLVNYTIEKKKENYKVIKMS